MARIFGKFIGFRHAIGYFAAECRSQQLSAEYNFVDPLKLGQGEQRRHQVKNNIGIFHLAPQAFNRVLDQLQVVKGEAVILRNLPPDTPDMPLDSFGNSDYTG
ncbi:hypothetical protein D3C75_875880 [compost metagenome]